MTYEINYNGEHFSVPEVPYNAVLLVDPTQQMPIVTPIDGRDLTLTFITHAGTTLADRTVTTNATYALRRQFLNDLGAAMLAVLDGTSTPPVTVEPDAHAPADHPRAVVATSTVYGWPKLTLRFESRPGHAEIATHVLDAWPYSVPYESYARTCARGFAEERNFVLT